MIIVIAALLAQTGILRDADWEIIRKLKMFGLFLSAGQFHPCILVPKFESGKNIQSYRLFYTSSTVGFVIYYLNGVI